MTVARTVSSPIGTRLHVRIRRHTVAQAITQPECRALPSTMSRVAPAHAATHPLDEFQQFQDYSESDWQKILGHHARLGMEKTVTNTRLSAGMGPRTVMQHCYVEMLSPPMIRVTLAVVATVCIAMAAVGPAGSFEALSMLERMVSSALYAGICAPIFYSLGVVTAYFCRFRKPVEMIIALAGMSVYVAFPLGTAVYTIEGFAHPDYSEAIGLLPIYLSVATSAVACSILMSYLTWQRIRHAAPVTTRSDHRPRPCDGDP